jgi:uncharacterized protein
MRRYDKEIKDQLVIDEILNRSEICRIGLVDDSMAYIVPLNYGYAEGIIYMHSAPNGRKMEILKHNNRVSFEIEFASNIVRKDIACRWTAKYRSVMGQGVVEIISDAENKRKGMDIIMRKYGFEGDIVYDETSLSRMIILALKIEQIQGKQSGEWE